MSRRVDAEGAAGDDAEALTHQGARQLLGEGQRLAARLAFANHGYGRPLEVEVAAHPQHRLLAQHEQGLRVVRAWRRKSVSIHT